LVPSFIFSPVCNALAELIPNFRYQQAFNLDNFKSITLDGLWIAGFQSFSPFTGSDDGIICVDE
jgi:hypothetical protein